MPTVDLSFALEGATIPLDYAYGLYSALCRVVPTLHGDRRIGVHPVRGVKLERGRLTLVPQSRLRLRMPSGEIGTYLALGGERLDLGGSFLRIGIPRSEPLRPSSRLTSRLVTIGHRSEPEEFLDSVSRQLSGLGVRAGASFLPSPDPARPGEPCRRIVRIKGRKIVGYAVRIEGLTAEESLAVQEHGLGSRRRMGCGLFVSEGGSRDRG